MMILVVELVGLVLLFALLTWWIVEGSSRFGGRVDWTKADDSLGLYWQRKEAQQAADTELAGEIEALRRENEELKEALDEAIKWVPYQNGKFVMWGEN